MSLESRLESLDIDVWELEEKLRNLEVRLSFLEKLVKGEILCDGCQRPLLADGLHVEVHTENDVYRTFLCHSCFFDAARCYRELGWEWRILDEWGERP